MKKTKNKQGKKVSQEMKAQNTKLKKITVKNAEGDPDTTAEIVIQNKIDYTPKVSVIIPVYNVEQYLRECLDSVINQTLKEIEIICVDDGSTDRSLEILKEYAKKDNRITVMRQENKGSGPARNNGIIKAKGEFIAFMDSDDMYPNKNTLEHMYTTAIKNNVLICGGSLNQLKDELLITDSSKFEDGYTFEKNGIIEYKDYQFDYGYWRFIYNRQFLKENQLYFPDYLRGQDPPFFIKTMAMAKKFYALKEATYVYRVSYKQISWNERKAVDLFKGVADCLTYSKQYKLNKLHSKIVQRLNTWTFRTATATMIDNKKVRQQILKILNTIDYNILKKENISLDLDDIYKAIIQAKDNDIIVSVIVPCYNVVKYLSRCLDSIINQTFKSTEIICVNDGSTDNTLELLKNYAQKDSRIKIINKINGGLSSARNEGALESHGFFINFIDSDDWIEETTIEKAIAKMTGNIDLVCYGAELVNEGLDKNNQNIIVGNQYHKIKIIGEKTASVDNILNSTYTVWNKLFKKAILDKYAIKFAVGRLFEDNDFSIMYMVHCRNIYYLGDYLYHYVQRPNSIMEKVRAGLCDKTIDNLYIFDNLYKHLEKYNLLEKYKKIVASRFSIHLRSAYKFAPDHLKNDIKLQVKKLSKHYRKDLFWDNIIEKIENSKFHQIREMNTIIVSLTSYPARINTVNQTIETLLNQSMKADRVILWLAPEQFPNKEADLPQGLLALKDKGLTIDWYHDIRSYKKLIPTLKKYPDSIIVTADDDILYPVNWLENLYREYCKKPNTIWCHRAHNIKMKENTILSYKKWNFCISKNNSSYLNFCTSGGGVLYPPHCFYKDILDENKFLSLAPQADDIWLWTMLVMNNKKINVVQNNMKSLKIVENSQETALWYTNVLDNKNDEQLANVLKAYPKVLKKLKKEYYGSLLKPYFFFPYYLLRLPLVKKKYSTAQIKQAQNNLTPARIDIKNFGGADNNQTVVAPQANISQPAWFTNAQGKGTVISSSAQKQKITVQAIKNGNLRFEFRGADKCYAQGVRIPVWIDYKSIKIDGKEILSAPVATWHDKPYRYEMPVKDGQTISVEVEQQPHQYSQGELRDLIIKLNPNSDFIRKNIDKLVKSIAQSATPQRGLKYFLYHKVKTEKYKKTYICGIRVWKKKIDIYTYLDTRLAQIAQAQQGQLQAIAKQIQPLQTNLQNQLNTSATQLKSVIEAQKKEFQDKINAQTAQMNNLESLVIGQSHVMQAKVANLADSLVENLAQNAETYQNMLSTTLKDLQTTLKQSATRNKNAILESLENSADSITNKIQKQIKDPSADLLNIKNTVFEAVKNQSNIQAQFRAYNDGATQAHLATQNIVHDVVSGVTSILQIQEKQSKQLETSEKNQRDEIRNLSSWIGNENSTIKDILQQQNAAYVENVANLSAQAKAFNDAISAQINETQKNLANFSSKNQQNYQELNYADLLHDCTNQSTWLKDKAFSLFGWAANYSFIYTLYRILDKINPINILEMGLGQTTKVTSQYVANKNPQAQLTVCEHNQDWIDIYKPDLPASKNIKINHFELEKFEYDGKPNDKYANLIEFVGKNKFDLIIVDGPVGGGKNLPRSNILGLIAHDNLAQDFIIVFDDAERKGEKETIAKAKELLNEKKTEFFCFERNGIKRQHIITSKSRDFAQYL